MSAKEGVRSASTAAVHSLYHKSCDKGICMPPALIPKVEQENRFAKDVLPHAKNESLC